MVSRLVLGAAMVIVSLRSCREVPDQQGSDADNVGSPAVEHVMVYHEPGMFGGWPANHGIWSWGDEILVGFTKGYYKDLGPTRHHMDRDKPEMHLLARSLDGGQKWVCSTSVQMGQIAAFC
ncbi:MAG: hypothetical protein JSU96_08390 [Acidobacteriota bacterium]|nr:MAG: hypothetical protein JSU96_08390 [Acidobacteriota bacterium]